MSGRHQRTIAFTLNGRRVTANAATHETILEVLQRDFGLFGARESCGQGLCGCCTLLVNGTAVSGCLYLAAFADGAELTTVEGLARNGELHPIQRAFIEKNGFQCGFCTPGFILMTKELLARHPRPTEGRDPALSVWESVSLRGVSRHHRGRAARRGTVKGLSDNY